MKKLFIIILLLGSIAQAADTKLTGLDELTAIVGTDILYVVDDPGGTPLSKKITATNLFDLIDTFAELNAIVADKTLVNEEDAVTWDALGTFGLGITITTGDPFTLGANRIDNGSDLLDGEMIAADTIDNDPIDWSDMIDLTTDGAVSWGNLAAGELGDDSVNDDDINWADLTYLTTNGAGIDEAYAVGWNADVGPPEKDDIYDYLHNFDADDDGSFTDETWLTGWIGSTNITTLGTIATGTWEGDAVDHERGGLEADISSYTGLVAITGGSTAEVDSKSELEGHIADVTDFAEADGDIWTGDHDHSGATLTMPKRTKNDDRFYTFNLFNPNSLYDTDTQICFDPNTEAALTITEVQITCDADPTTELDIDLKFADAFIGLANATLIEPIDTTNGTTDIDSGFDDATVPAGKCLYIEFGADPDSNIKQVMVKIKFDYD